MCTVSVIALGPGLRLLHSRDEQRNRPEALPPRWHEVGGGRRAIWPIDPQGGGTWVAARDDGLALAIMNVNPEPAPALEGLKLESRGLIIPRLMGLEAADIPSAAADLDPMAYACFRLVMLRVGEGGPTVTAWTSRRLGPPVAEPVRAPACWPTSGLGDSRVAARLPRFLRTVGGDPTPQAQDDYHLDDRGPGFEAVLMTRPDARTVSLTRVEVLGPGEVALRYTPIPPTGL